MFLAISSRFEALGGKNLLRRGCECKAENVIFSPFTSPNFPLTGRRCKFKNDVIVKVGTKHFGARNLLIKYRYIVERHAFS